MSDLLLEITFGNYISPIRLLVFVGLFLAWLAAINWVNIDAKAVMRKRHPFWFAVIFAAGAVGLLLWIAIPLYFVGVIVFALLGGASLLMYVMKRDAKVATYEKILSVDKLKSLFENKQKKAAEIKKGLTYITANKNEVPTPLPKTAEFFGMKVANDLFEDALWRRTTEVVLTPTGQNTYNVTYRIDGVAYKQPPRTKEDSDHLIHFLKQLADLDAAEKRKPQKGLFTIRKGKDSVQWEVNTAGSVAGEQVKLNQVEVQNVRKLDELGLAPDQYEQLSKVREIKGKIFIISGPKKSGVSTTFYAFLKGHDPFINSIVTLERHISADVPNITQSTFALSDTGTTTFARRTQTLIRTAPEIIGVADVDDTQTATVLCNAAKTGVHVYITIEADSAMQALAKWMKLVNNQALVAETLAGVTNQRLIRKLCQQCRQAYEPNKDLLKKFNIPADKVKTLYRPGEAQLDRKGRPIPCQACQSTGFVGRMATFESIVMNDELVEAVKQAKSLQEIAGAFRRARMLFLQEQALRKVVDGTTAINELIREFQQAQQAQAKPDAPAAPAQKA